MNLYGCTIGNRVNFSKTDVLMKCCMQFLLKALIDYYFSKNDGNAVSINRIV